jgi:hypothetical protein
MVRARGGLGDRCDCRSRLLGKLVGWVRKGVGMGTDE